MLKGCKSYNLKKDMIVFGFNGYFLI